MLHPRPASLPAIACAVFSTALAAQQSVEHFIVNTPMIRIAVRDLPGWLSGVKDGPLGQIFAEADVADAFALGAGKLRGDVDRWLALGDELERGDPNSIQLETRCQRAVYRTDWHDLQGFQLCAIPLSDRGFNIKTCLVLEPVAAAEARATKQFEAIVEAMRASPSARDQMELAKEQAVQGHPGIVLRRGTEEESPVAFWIVHAPGQFVGAEGSPEEIGKFQRTAPDQPALALDVDLRGYVELMLFGFGAENTPQVAALRRAFGIEEVGVLHWRVQPRDGLLQDDIAIETTEPFTGLLEALATGMAPPTPQPLPDHALLQFTCNFDMPALLHAIDDLLVMGNQPSTADLGVAEDLRKALTGGITLGITRPAPMSLLPRMYLSLGIVDHDALDRVLARLRAAQDLPTKDLQLEGNACVEMRVSGFPAALQPTWCIQKDTLHFADSATSMRALLKATANGAPPAMDVDKAPRPRGKGVVLPGCEMRFDPAEIHAALQQIWLPIYEKQQLVLDGTKSLLQVASMPDVVTVTKHLGKGRGVLRREPNRIVLSMLGPAGGPELGALLTCFGPMLSANVVQSWEWQCTNMTGLLQRSKMTKVHEALAAFEKRTGKRAASLGELLAGGDLADASQLLVTGDPLAEAVMHEGKEVGKTSFRYFPNGVKVSPQGSEIEAELIAISLGTWQRLAIDREGNVHEGWGDFAAPKLDDVLKGK